jgi:hypothetical protein
VALIFFIALAINSGELVSTTVHSLPIMISKRIPKQADARSDPVSQPEPS